MNTTRHTDLPPALGTLERLGNRWTVRVLVALGDAGTLRYNEARHAVAGISQRRLTLALRDLERGGLVARRIHATFPPRVDYEITGLGRELAGRLGALQEWMQVNGVVIPAQRRTFHGRPRSLPAR
jgi:DNA-binding HxlR family transcriptional regulator